MKEHQHSFYVKLRYFILFMFNTALDLMVMLFPQPKTCQGNGVIFHENLSFNTHVETSKYSNFNELSCPCCKYEICLAFEWSCLLYFLK